MLDGLTIGGAISGLKSAGDIVTAALKLRDAALLQEKIIELNGVILTAQQNAAAAQKEQLALLDEVRQLKARVMELEGKGSERERYKRTDMGGGTFAYTPKDGVEKGEAAHALCANCYEKGHLATLQRAGTSARKQEVYKCMSCESTFHFGEPQQPQSHYREGGSWGRARR